MIVFITFMIAAVLDLVASAIFFPIPVTDTSRVRYNTLPWATLTLIGINVGVFLGWQAPDFVALYDARAPESVIDAYLAISAKYWTFGFREVFLSEGASIGAFTSFTSIFMHGDFGHLFSNMIFLWAFGRRVEDACGSWRFLVFYALAGMTANIGSALILTDDVPGIGASGAIMGVLGAYIVLFPGTRIDCLWGLGLPFQAAWVWIQRNLRGKPAKQRWTVQLPALLVVLLYIVFDIANTFDTIATGELESGVNYVAHTTGFLAALAVLLLMRRELFTKFFTARRL
jgi:membrane associated rhomboid family serine protease